MFVDTLTHLQQKFDFFVGVEMTKKRLSTFYMLQNLEGEPLPGFISFEVQCIVSSRASKDGQSFCKRNYTDHT